MSNSVSIAAATDLATAYGEFCKLRVADDRTRADSLNAIRVCHWLQGAQREAGIELVADAKLAKLARFFEAEGA